MAVVLTAIQLPSMYSALDPPAVKRDDEAPELPEQEVELLREFLAHGEQEATE